MAGGLCVNGFCCELSIASIRCSSTIPPATRGAGACTNDADDDDAGTEASEATRPSTSSNPYSSSSALSQPIWLERRDS